MYDGALKEKKVPRDRIRIAASDAAATAADDQRTLIYGREVNVVVPCHYDEVFVYRSNTGQWCISEWEDMNVCSNTGVVCVTSDALLPFQVVETWRVWQGEAKWPHDARVTCVVATPPAGVENRPSRRGAIMQSEAQEEGGGWGR
jgi:hypothetical protein